MHRPAPAQIMFVSSGGMPPVWQRRRAFTLIEILVALGIITLLVLLALPAFSFITGSRSGESALNQISAALAVARAQAVGIQQPRGIAFFHDLDTDRTVGALVELRGAGIGTTWVAGTAVAGGERPHSIGEYVKDTSGAAYVCIQDHTDTGSIDLSKTDYWRKLDSYAVAAPQSMIEITDSNQSVVLPKGVSVRSIGNVYTRGSVPFDYSNPAVIMFDGNGQVMSQEFRLLREGVIGNKIDFQATASVPVSPTILPVVATSPFLGFSGVGLAVFDSEIFRNGTQGLSNTSTTDVPKIENWISRNATFSMVNRYNGTLVKGE